MKRFSSALAACIVVIGAGCDAAASKDIEVQSAPEVRPQLPGFIVRDITGPSRGQSGCYCCRYGLRPVVVVFLRELDDGVRDLLQKIDLKVAENKDHKLCAFAVVLTDEKQAFEPRLKALAKDAGIANTPLTILDSPALPAEYQIDADADVTVMMWVEKEVLVKRSFNRGDLDKTTIDSLVAETNKILK